MMRMLMVTTMRTTLTVDDDLLATARQRAELQGLSLTDVLNRALRRGLAEDQTPRASEPTIQYGDPGAPGPDDAALRAWTAKLDQELAVRQLVPSASPRLP